MSYLYFENKNIMDISIINKTKSFEGIKDVKTQVVYYMENSAHSDIVKIVALGNKSFGERMQKIIMEYFNLDKPSSTGHDIQQNSLGIKFEVKSSRFWVTNGDWKWQHIMENHNYDYLLLCGVNFNSVDVFIISKTNFLELKNKKVVTQQGGAEGQGLWCNYSKIKKYLTPIKSVEDLNKFIGVL